MTHAVALPPRALDRARSRNDARQRTLRAAAEGLLAMGGALLGLSWDDLRARRR